MGDKASEENDMEAVGLSCALEMFSESKEVIEMINNLPNMCGSERKRDAEKAYERFKFIINQYKDQPHLLDPDLDEVLINIVQLVRKDGSQLELKHKAFKYLFLVTNVRGYKVVVRHLPHEVADLEPVLQLLEEQDSNFCETWETRYCLLLWLAIIVMIPFHMTRLDSGLQNKTVMDRLVDVCHTYLMSVDACREVAAFLSARYLTRSDVKEVHLAPFISWAVTKITEKIPDSGSWDRFGPLASIAAILKHGKREDILPHSAQLLKCMMAAKCREDKYPLSSKFAMKIVARIGLTFLKPRVTTWRYDRGNRSLVINLRKGQGDVGISKELEKGKSLSCDKVETTEEEDEDIPPEIEDVIDELIQGLQNENNITRWSAAKGIGRVMSRLNKQCGDDVVCSVLELLDERYAEGAWHGGCLALAELAKRGLLLPARLSDVIPLVMKALIYDQQRGTCSVGANVRDAACYVCWGFARAYLPSVIEPYASLIAKNLLLVACFDREINCRRAAAAAFQENVGRLGNFPHGIEILTTADYFTVGNRSNAFLKISVFIAQFEEYTDVLINHLLYYKVNSWDPAIRTLAAEALFNLTPFAHEFMADEGILFLLTQSKKGDINVRHGALLAVGEVVHALSLIDGVTLESIYLDAVQVLIPLLKKANSFKGLSGELMKIAACSFIENCCRAKLPYDREFIIREWQELIDECVCFKKAELRQASAKALTQLCLQYYVEDSEYITLVRHNIIDKYVTILKSKQESERMGCALALGLLPSFMFRGSLSFVVNALIWSSRITPETLKWAEIRSESLRALTNICLNVGLAKTDTTCSCYNLVLDVLEALLKGMQDYTNDSRGDVGAWVRESAMKGLKDLIFLMVNEASELLTEDLVGRVFVEISQQTVEKIDRTRKCAGAVFSSLLYKDNTPVPYIPGEQRLKEIFPRSLCDRCTWISASETFPLFVQLLSLPQYSNAIMLGLICTVGGITESLVKNSSHALFEYLRSQPSEEIVRLCDVVVDLFEIHQYNDRVTIPMFTFLDRLINSNCVSIVLLDSLSIFADRLVHCSKKEIAKSTNVKKLTASVNVFCQLIQVPGTVSRRSLTQLGIMLCHRFLWLRRATATKLYESLLVYIDEFEIEPSDMEQALNILSETEWASVSTEEARAKRNTVCLLLGVPIPVTGAKV